MATSTQNVAAGWGVVAQATIEAGEVLCVIPRAACFGASAPQESTGDSDAESEGSDGSVGEDSDSEMQRDTQRALATLLLQEQDKGDNSRWAPLLAMLTPAHTPLVWSAAAARFLEGTELAPVLAHKRTRMVEERGACPELRHRTDAQYAAACALAASHANPYFGVSVVPFNTTLNWSTRPNTEFVLEHVDAQLVALAPDALAAAANTRCVVGRALCRVEAGMELTQAYDESTAMLVYRCGFAPTAAELEGARLGPGESVAWGSECAVSVSLELLARACGCDGDVASPAVVALRASGALDACPWDGLGHIVTAELQRGGTGTAKLVGVCLVLLLGDEDAQRVADAVRIASDGGESGGAGSSGASGREDVDPTDVAAAALVAALEHGAETRAEALLAVALSAGGEESDPWPALVSAARFGSDTIAAAAAAAAGAIEARSEALACGGRRVPTREPASASDAAAWHAAQGLRRAEAAILGESSEVLERWRRKGGGLL